METLGAHARPDLPNSLVLNRLGYGRSLELGSDALIRPFASAATAWAIYRLVSGFTQSRAWLRLIAVIAFSLAALHSFGLLKATLEVLN